jgi:poly(A) polymerase/tRNA nucleotidyltransferase (CCA-adding enzyme)
MSNEYTIPEEVTRVTGALKDAGFEAYLVGGCVRDLLCDKKPKDWDITTNAHPEDIEALFEETYYNNNFGTVGVVLDDTSDESLKVIEVTPYRKEGGYTDARRPDTVLFGVSLEEDLARRDFTVNAIAYDASKGHTVDPYKGQDDLSAQLLRAVGNPDERFKEDALRMLRAIRLGAELGFGIEQETFTAIQKNAHLLERISQERIRDEVIRIIMSPQPMEAMLHMKQTDLLMYVLPELLEGDNVAQNHSHIYNVFEHSLRSLQHAADKNFSLEVRFSALFHDIGKPISRRKSKDGKSWTFYGHEMVGSRVTRKALQRLRFPKEIVEKIVNLVRWHMFFSDPDKITLSAVRRMIVNVGEDNIWNLLHVRRCDRIGSGRPKEQPFRFRKYKSMVEEALRDPISVSMLKIDGSHIMNVTRENPGPRIGNIMHALLEEVLDDPSRNTAEYLEKRALELSLLQDEELKELGNKGKSKKEVEEEREVEELRKKHHVT